MYRVHDNKIPILNLQILKLFHKVCFGLPKFRFLFENEIRLKNADVRVNFLKAKPKFQNQKFQNFIILSADMDHMK